MGAKTKLTIAVICIVIITLFVYMCYLMKTVNPPPLAAKPPLGPTPRMIVQKGADTIDQWIRASENDSVVTDDYRNLKLYTIPGVVPPLWPLTPEPPPVQLDQPPEDKESERKVNVTTITYSDIFLIDKRSVDVREKRISDLDSVILKVTDDKGKFNIEIKVGTNDASTKKQIETREIQSKDVPKYSMSLKTKNNELYEISELAKSTIIHVKPNDSVSIDDYDDLQKKTVEDNINQASIKDLINNTDKSAIMPMVKNALPISVFSNKTKLKIILTQMQNK